MRAFLCLLFDLFGEPGAIAARSVFGRRGRALLMPWLRAGEAFLRRLLFIEALALAPDLRAGPSKPRARAPRQRRLVHFFPDKPGDWRVSFRLVPHRGVFSPGRRGVRRANAASLALPPALCAAPEAPERKLWRTRVVVQPAPPSGATAHSPRDPHNAWPIAERFEAMLRTFNAPQHAVRRLARLLLRDESRTLRTLQPASARLANLFGAQSFARCDAIVASRRRRRDRPTRADSS